MASLKDTIVLGKLTVTDKIIKSGGTSNQILLANGDTANLSNFGGGSVTKVAFTSGDGISLTGDTEITESGTLTISHANTSDKSSLAANGRTYITGLTIDQFGHVTDYETGTETVTNTWRGIQNNLTSDSTTESLSAAQGKALKALVDGKANTEHGTHVTTATVKNALGTGSGTTKFLREDGT
jgi:hypothetical protein